MAHMKLILMSIVRYSDILVYISLTVEGWNFSISMTLHTSYYVENDLQC